MFRTACFTILYLPGRSLLSTFSSFSVEINLSIEFLSRNEQQNTAEANADKRKLTQSARRLAELDKLIGSVYEDKVLGKIPEEVCINLLEKNLSMKQSPRWSRRRRPSVMMRQTPMNSSAVRKPTWRFRS